MRSKILFVFLSAMAATQFARAESPSVTAVLTSSQAAVNQPVQLQIKVSGSRGAEAPEQISVDGLEIQSAGETRSFEMFNLDVKSSVTFNYTIFPTRPGTFKIPPQTLRVDGKTLRTPELTLNVSGSSRGGGGSARSGQSNGDVDPSKFGFVELILTKQSAYVGEIIPTEVRVGFSVPVESLGGGIAITGQGFTTQKMPEPHQSIENINGRQYQVLTFKTAIAAARAGKIEIGPAEITPVVRIPQRAPRAQVPRDLFDMNDPFFNNFFSDPMFAPSTRKEITLRSKPAALEVKALPPNPPPNFSGAVGTFAMTADAKPKTGHVGDPITVNAEISGRGTFDRVNAPIFEDERGWHKYPPSSKFKQDDDVGLSGTKSFETVVSANEPKTSVPPLVFSFFDPLKENYVTLRSQPIAIRMEGGAQPAPTIASAPTASTAPTSAPAPAAPTSKPADILYQLNDFGRTSRSFAPIFARSPFWVAQIIPLLAFFAFLGWQFRRSRLQDRDTQRKAALQSEMAELQRKLRRGKNSPREYFAEASRAVQVKTALAKNLDPNAVDAETAATAFQVDEPTRARLRELFARSDELRYSGSQNGAETISAEHQRATLDLIDNLRA